jgi:hypothetical protein
MRRKIRFGRCCLPVLLAGLSATGLYAAGRQRTDAATSAFSTKSAATSQSSLQLNRMLLLLAPGTAQQTALDSLLQAQQTPGNPGFHKWLTPSQFAARFAPSNADAAQVAAWLKSQGFQVAPLPASRGWIEFSGTAAQVQHAFGASVQPVSDNSGSTRYQLAGKANFPASLATNIQGLVSLDGVVSTPAITAPSELTGTTEALAAQTSITNAAPLTPSLALGYLNLPSAKAATATGAGESIAILSRSNVRTEDFAAFRSSFGLPESAIVVTPAGIDPGRTDEEPAAIQAASWAGAVAPQAQILLVPAASTNATDGIDLALASAIDGAVAHTIAVGYSACESSMSTAHQGFYAALYRQASAEGIAVIAATGDSGAAACHLPQDTRSIFSGFGVNALASTPWNTAVGAVAFTADASALAGWQTTGSSSYATGGGASTLYPTPKWQAAAGLPLSDPDTTASHHRYLPDISLPTGLDGIGSKGLAFCYSGASAPNGCRLVTAGGSSASAAIFSGVAALLAQKYGPQGNLAPNLYALHQAETSSSSTRVESFVDVAKGSALLPCVIESPNCTASSSDQQAGTIGFEASAGYDLASGLGSVNPDTLLRGWATPQATGTSPVTVEMTNVGGITYNPSAIIILSAKVISGSGGSVPTGTVQFYDETTSGNTGTPATLSSAGIATYQESGEFTDGGHNIAAIYSGDSTYATGESQPVTINVQPSPTALTVAPSTIAPTSGAAITVTGTVTSTNPGATAPTGTLTVNLDGLPQGTSTLSTTGTATTGSVSVTVPTAGSHTIQGTYSGDSNYNNSTSPSVTITVAKTASVTGISATPSVLTTGVPESFTATVAPLGAVAGTTYVLTGTVSFYDGGVTLLGTAVVSSNTAILTGVSLSATAAHTITAVYSGDATYSASTSSPLLLEPTLLPVTVTLTESNTIIAPDQPVTLVATVTPVNVPPLTAEQHPSGYILFYAGTTLISGQVPIAVGNGDSSVGSTIIPHLAAGSYVITAQYSGDPTYGPAVSNSLNIQAEDFTISCNATTVSVVQGSSVAPAPICTISSLGGLSGPIAVACAEQDPPQVGPISCIFDPSVIDSTGQTTLTISTTAGNISLNSSPSGAGSVSRPSARSLALHRHPSLWPAAGGGVALAFAGLLLSPIGRRARLLRANGTRLVAIALLLFGMAGAGLGCGNSVTISNNGGTPLGVHTLKITAGALVNTVTVTHVAYLTVNVTP